MDPQAALDAAQIHLTKGKKSSGWRALQHFAEGGESLNNCWEWRQGGGFEPKGGDHRAEDIAEKLSDAWEKESDAQDRDRAVHADRFDNPCGCDGIVRGTRVRTPDGVGVVFKVGDKISVRFKGKTVNDITIRHYAPSEVTPVGSERSNNPGLPAVPDDMLTTIQAEKGMYRAKRAGKKLGKREIAVLTDQRHKGGTTPTRVVYDLNDLGLVKIEHGGYGWRVTDAGHEAAKTGVVPGVKVWWGDVGTGTGWTDYDLVLTPTETLMANRKKTRKRRNPDSFDEAVVARELSAAVAEDIGIPDLEYTDVSGTEVLTVSDDRYIVFLSEDAAHEAAVTYVAEMLAEEPELFNQDWLLGHINEKRLADWVRQAVLEDDYASEIASEDPDRFWEEAEQWGVTIPDEDEREAADPTDYADELAEAIADDRAKDPMDWLNDIWGDEAMKKALDIAGIDIQGAADAAVSADGWAHFLSNYDGNYDQLPSGYIYYKGPGY